MDFAHIPVMLEECMQGLNLKSGGIYFDGTVGGGGHSYEILKRTSPDGRLIATDLDDEAIAAATQRLKEFDGRFKIYKSDYKDFETVFGLAETPLLDGAILDFGVSSYQLDNEERGFSYMRPNAPLDMRMDATQEFTAQTLINEYPREKISEVLKKYGEEKFAPAIAKAILRAREKEPIQRTGTLVDLIREAIPAKARRTGGHPAKRVFQALRIEVNGELESLSQFLERAFDRLKPGGRIAVITFQSLEDRMVKQKFAALCKGCTCPPDFPVCVCGNKPKARLVFRKSVQAGPEELEHNSRSKSARLRAIEKLEEMA